jgi:hypothetical protein
MARRAQYGNTDGDEQTLRGSRAVRSISSVSSVAVRRCTAENRFADSPFLRSPPGSRSRQRRPAPCRPFAVAAGEPPQRRAVEDAARRGTRTDRPSGVAPSSHRRPVPPRAGRAGGSSPVPARPSAGRAGARPRQRCANRPVIHEPWRLFLPLKSAVDRPEYSTLPRDAQDRIAAATSGGALTQWLPACLRLS